MYLPTNYVITELGAFATMIPTVIIIITMNCYIFIAVSTSLFFRSQY